MMKGGGGSGRELLESSTSLFLEVYDCKPVGVYCVDLKSKKID